MDENLRLLILKKIEERKPGLKIDRSKELIAITESGAKIRHDDGGRLLLIELSPGEERILTARLPGIRIVPVDTDIKKIVSDSDPNESLFLDALRIRASKSYREAKKTRKFGETPEEKQLTTGSCIRGY